LQADAAKCLEIGVLILAVVRVEVEQATWDVLMPCKDRRRQQPSDPTVPIRERMYLRDVLMDDPRDHRDWPIDAPTLDRSHPCD
jgi:hypothetical protein